MIALDTATSMKKRHSHEGSHLLIASWLTARQSHWQMVLAIEERRRSLDMRYAQQYYEQTGQADTATTC